MKKMDRRRFIKTGAALGGLAVTLPLSAGETSPIRTVPDISTVRGEDFFEATVKAVEQLGGMERFISQGDKVGLLANSWYKKPGTYTRPDVVLAVAHLCLEAGAGEVHCMREESESYWSRSPHFEKHKKLVARLISDEKDHRLVEIPRGKILKEAKVLNGFLDYDKVINIPIVKNHGEIRMTCTLKNTMGVSAFSTNIRFHTGPNLISGAVKTLMDNYHNMEHLAQCIADLNLVRPFDLYVVDATEFITTNGPSGPGNMSNLHRVVAGTDRVAVDAFCSRYLGLDPTKEPMIIKAYENDLGEIDLGKLTIGDISI
ncbi:MAG: DUF362 domain-containing protein [Proteobacteria bacterium]|nr:DUF362 domain-containing protein [Pseudomonadota bacterium]